jgi:phage tail-like protein
MPQTTNASPGTRPNLYLGYQFKLEIRNVTEAHFSYVSGIGMKVTPIDWREGGLRSIVRRLPGQVQYSDVTLKYGLTSSQDLFNWMMTVVNGNVQRQNVSIVQLDAEGAAEVVRWDLMDAFPVKWEGAVLDALGSAVAIETLVLTYESIAIQRS